MRRAPLILACGLLTAAIAWVGMENRLFRAPYPPLGKAIAWLVASPEPAYNFDVVRPGLVYRSGAPDDRLIRYVHERYGVERVVSLAGPYASHDIARELGMDVRVFDWPGDGEPPPAELEAVLALIGRGSPVLVHCHHGVVRSGIAVDALLSRLDSASRSDASARLDASVRLGS